MAKICCGSVVSEGEASTPYEPRSRAARRRRMEMRRFRFGGSEGTENEEKRQKFGLPTGSVSCDCDNTFDNTLESGNQRSETKAIMAADRTAMMSPPLFTATGQPVSPKFGVASICGRRRDMEDAVAIHPFFCRREHDSANELHYFGVYDGHGCSHVAMKCRDRLHEVVKEELENKEARTEWKNAMEQSFHRMDKEVISWNESMLAANCRCELQSPECDAVGSTAVVAIVTPDKIIVANCGDSRAVLCRNGKAVALSTDHKPDRPDELNRIQAAGGRVIYWDGPRVLGVLAMSRAIGDYYLKPYVSCDPEVTVTDRTAEDDCLILASDGLWDVVSNDTACGVARTCLRGKAPVLASALASSSAEREAIGKNADKACSDASMLLTKLALARRSSDNVSVVVVDLRRDT
ncbi:probable protein phosphatase 2C 24 isoform X2 [Actinidia eriantha]|uniref:probable protein phosphatase 2C 24 isoform X2 n=1 Tax=Actinidia eriantha TaxID=165200 RepID=UPI00258DE141|nr:probable protein phosphatase 2C 24 isoform X2 [Actinidia eriantha]